MDAEGYPEEHELTKIKEWDYKDFPSLLDFIEVRWAYRWYERRVVKDFNGNPILEWDISTAGWSGNEDIIYALLENKFFKMMWYYSWRTGGHYVFRIDPVSVGFKLIKEYCKENNVSKQWISKAKDKFEYFKLSKNKTFVRIKPRPPVIEL